MLHRVAVVRTDILKEYIISIISVTRSSELGTTVVFLRNILQLLVIADVPSSPILMTPMMAVIHTSETSVLTRGTWHIPEDGILNPFVYIIHMKISHVSYRVMR
jgi:hypothetical protein